MSGGTVSFVSYPNIFRQARQGRFPNSVKFVENTLIPSHTNGRKREHNREYYTLLQRAYRLRKRSETEAAAAVKQQAQHMPTREAENSEYLRLKYVRDDA